jgi:hypothetical protein
VTAYNCQTNSSSGGYSRWAMWEHWLTWWSAEGSPLSWSPQSLDEMDLARTSQESIDLVKKPTLASGKPLDGKDLE